jgi:phospholipid/cholesterol/gamma-HCH transport system substrate-binding protein
MASDVRETVVGGLAVVGLAGLLAVSYGGERLKPETGYLLKANFNRVDGLLPGDQVHVGGIKVGAIAAQRLTDAFKAEVTLRIDPEVKLPADTSAAIHTDGLFGAKFVVLEPGGEDRTLKNGDRITFTQDSVVVEDLLELIIAQGKAARAKASGQ